MHIFDLISKEIVRIKKRKQDAYTYGRTAGYERCIPFLKFSLFPSEYDLLDIRTVMAEYCNNGEMDSDIAAHEDAWRAGFRRSFRNVYHTVGFMVQDPMAIYNEITSGQWKLISILSERNDTEFIGMTREEANTFIEENDHGKKNH